MVRRPSVPGLGLFTIPLVPVLGVALAARFEAGRGLARWLWGLVATGIALALLMFAQPRAMRMVNGRLGPPTVELLAGDVSPSRYLPYASSRAGSTAPPWGPPASERRVMGIWVVALAGLLLLDRLNRRGPLGAARGAAVRPAAGYRFVIRSAPAM
jgi:hypothetical protein